MFFLVIGTVTNLILTIVLVPIFGLNGAAIATMSASFIIMILTTLKSLQVTETKLHYTNLSKITIASILGFCLLLIPKTAMGMLIYLLINSYCLHSDFSIYPYTRNERFDTHKQSGKSHWSTFKTHSKLLNL
jgi:O-antigen/teichoic acid export membrane protein